VVKRILVDMKRRAGDAPPPYAKRHFEEDGMPRTALLVSVVVLILAAACAPAAPSPTAAPAKPALSKAEGSAEAAKPAATAAPAKPTEAKPAASPAAKAEAKPAASPAAKPAEAKPAASPAAKDVSVPKPSGDLAVKLGDTAALSFSDLGFALTAERLNKEGWKLERISFAQTELSVEALAKGDVHVTNVASNLIMSAIQKGAKIAMIADAQANEWVVVAKSELKGCADLSGKRVAYHSEGAVSTTMLKVWVDETCKGTPNYLVIAGSENRAIALANNQIDATPLKMSDWVKIEKQNPGKFHLLTSFAEGLKDLSSEPYAINLDWLGRNREVAVAWMAETLRTHRQVDANPKLLEESAPRLLEEKIAPEELAEAIKAYQAINIFPVNGGLTRQKVEGTIKFFSGRGGVAPGGTVEQMANFSVLDGALGIVGRVPGKL
jgi:hypothetical protein